MQWLENGGYVMEGKIFLAIVEDTQRYGQGLAAAFSPYVDEVEVLATYDELLKRVRHVNFNLITIDTIPSGNISGLLEVVNQVKEIVEKRGVKTFIISVSSSREDQIKSVRVDGYVRKVVEPCENVEKIMGMAPNAKRMAILEDNRYLAEEYKELYLKSKHVNECAIILNYNELLKKAIQEGFDLITIDAIPGGDVTNLSNVVKQLRNYGVKSFITAVSSLRKDQIKVAGIDAYIPKSHSPDEVVRKIVRKFGELIMLGYEYQIFVEDNPDPVWTGRKYLQENFEKIRRQFSGKDVCIKWEYIGGALIV